jgi:hypothetical protein
MALNPVKIYAYQGTVFFDGGSRVVDPKPVGTLVASSVEGDRVKIDRTDQETPTGEPRNVFRRMINTRALNQDGESLVDDLGYTQAEVIDYLNEQFNKPAAAGAVIVGATQSIGFTSDDTSTSVLVTDGSAYAKNALRAYTSDSGLINVSEHTSDGADVYVDIYREQLEVEGSPAGDTLETAVNTLNATLAGSAIGLGGVSISPTLPYQAPAAATLNLSSYMTQVTAELAGSSGSWGYHRANIYTTETISEPGEYFTAVVEGGEAIWGLGLYDLNNLAEVQDVSSAYNGHKGMWFSVWWHPTPDGPWSTYGYPGGTLIYGPGWSNTTTGFRYNQEATDWANGDPILVRVGITTEPEGFLGVWYWNASRSEWLLVARSANPMPYGEYGLKFVAADTSSRIHTTGANAIKIFELDTTGQAISHFYIESPDGSFDYPLHSSEADAAAVDIENGGAGSATQRTYIDDSVVGRIWWSPDTGFTQGDTAAPTSTDVVWNIIPTQPDGLFAPSAFTLPDQTLDELASSNIQVQPLGAVSYSTAVSGLPAGMSFDGLNAITGSAPEVTNDYVANPSDVYQITVTRTNSYGSVSTAFDLTVLNRTAPVTAVTGANHVSGTTALVDPDTMDDGSVVRKSNTLDDGERFIIDTSYVETYILPALVAGGAGTQVWVGVEAGAADFVTSIDAADFEAYILFEYTSATSHTVTLAGDTTSALTINSMTSAVYDYAFEADDTLNNIWVIGCNIGSIMNEPSPSAGGQFTRAIEKTSVPATPHNIAMGVVGGTLDFDPTALTYIATPATPSSSTSWGKAVDFSGGSEHAAQASATSSTNALLMSGLSTTVPANATAGFTSDDSNSRPWATAVVFKYDGHASNQHIWNLGEGTGSTDDNIYLRLDASGDAHFGWGRGGAVNECKILSLGTSINTNHWHGFYIAHTGERLSGADATAANLADAFSIRWYTTNNGGTWGTSNTEYSTATNWTAGSTGARMDRAFANSSAFSVGGRGSNRNFHGQVASMVVTTLERNVAMPTDAEIEKMMGDPVGWLSDYKVGNSYRPPANANSNSSFSLGTASPSHSTQVWLMGDGASDIYPTLRNEVSVNDTTTTSLTMQNQVSNDIVNVNIPGLS